MDFRGFPADGLAFYEQLAADNSKSFWQENKQRYDDEIRGPMAALADALDDYGPFHLFRPHNDLRFSKNKPPYKTHQGAYGESEGGAGYYMQISAEGLFVGAGYYSMAKDQLARFRSAVDNEATGAEVEALVADVQRRRYAVGSMSELKTAPRGYPKDHPRIELLRRKGLLASRDFGAPRWVHSKQVVQKVRDAWAGVADLCAWLDANVGPSTLPPEDGW
ncbi:MAG: DUF2461 domain-containing protein [Actinomycetota bacterium]